MSVRAGRGAMLLVTAAALALGALAPGARAATTLDEAAPKRFAIVVGNADYRNVPDLRNARADAGLVAKFLDEQGYSVTEYADLDKAGFEAMLQRILLEVDKDSEVVFYYAGHGVQIGGANYLIPVDAELPHAYDLPFEAMSLTTIVDVLGARARTQIVDPRQLPVNPFAGALVLADITGTPSETARRLQRADRADQLAPRLLDLAGRERLRRHRREQPLHRRARREAHRTPSAHRRPLEQVRRQVYRRHRGPAGPLGELDPGAVGRPSASPTPPPLGAARRQRTRRASSMPDATATAAGPRGRSARRSP